MATTPETIFERVWMRVYLLTLGCKVNQYESMQAREQLLSYGHELTDQLKKADLIVINTCSVTHIADRKSRQMINRARHANSKATLIITGCMPENKEIEIPTIAGAQIVYKKDLPNFLREYQESEADKRALALPESRVRRTLLVQNGCKQFCSYCKIPFLRQNHYSVPVKQVLEEMRTGLERGVQEFVLTGINLGTYKDGDADLSDLLRQIMEISGNFRVRLGSMEPNLVTDALLGLLETQLTLTPHIHIPLQGATDRLLKAMNRKYPLAEYFAILERIRGLSRRIWITTDLIVGFPSETEEEFVQTLKILEGGYFLDVHVFPFSPRKGTAAYELPDRIPHEEQKKRVHLAIQSAMKTRLKLLENLLNIEMTVLLEERKQGYLYGYSEQYVKVRIPQEPSVQLNQFVKVTPRTLFEDNGAGLEASLQTSP